MAAQDVHAAEVVDVRVPTDKFGSAKTKTLVNTRNLQVVRLVVAAGKQLETHKARGELTVLCVHGRVQFFVEGEPHELAAGRFLHLAAGVPHAVRAEEDSVLLLSIVTATDTAESRVDAVQEASEESFPASDPPARTPITGP